LALSIFTNENGHFLPKRANKEKKLNTFTALEKEEKKKMWVASRQNLTCF
jgi:hypothetical protein